MPSRSNSQLTARSPPPGNTFNSSYSGQLAVTVHENSGQWSEEDYGRGQAGSVSPRGYGSATSTPHSTGGSTSGQPQNYSANAFSSQTPSSVASSTPAIFNASRVSGLVSSPFTTMNPFALPTCNSQSYSPLVGSTK